VYKKRYKKGFNYQSEEEKTMVNKKIWLGILVMVLVFGMTVVGCEEEQDNGKFTILNDCDYYSITEIQVWGGSGTDINETVALSKGQSKSFTLSNGDYKFSVKVNYTGKDATPVIRNPEILIEQSQKMQYGIDYKCALSCYNSTEGIIREPGMYFSWAYNQ
jgi:hypothetical protein